MSRFARTAVLLAALLPAALGTIAPAAAQKAPAAAPAPGVSLPQILGGAPAGGEQVVPRRQVEVGGEFVRLGDLFSGLPQALADKVAAYAPPAGGSATFDHRRLDDIARENGITWQTVGGAPAEVIVSRAADTVGGDQILVALRGALAEQGLSPLAELELSSALRPAVVPAGTLNPVSILEPVYDARSGRFSAVVEMPSGDGRTTRQRVAGMAYDTIEVPVAVRPLSRDGVITDADIDWVKMRADRVQAGVATDAAQVVGMATKRAVRAGDTLRLRDLARPVLVGRNDLVTMILRSDFMTLTARGRALEDGAMGDTVRIRNERSNKTVLGRVVDSRTVVIDGTQNAADLTQ
ncbi:flagellar basal body P-ring formation chaperone FlgA [Novispirillum sp. DQ9]|uniref:flagellar basal body P-ring formation chaperone FlgA n=1 Tax=Novispirillum sp. DQ9 TaxID=3398612 RepID=UPI003C7E0B10